MTIATERDAVRTVLEDVADLHDVAESLPAKSSLARQRLQAVMARRLAAAPPIRPTIASELLGISEPTVRKWVDLGVLKPEATTPRLLLKPASVFNVRRVVERLREAGQTRNLLDAVYHALVDEETRAEPGMTESLRQMHAGDYTVRRPRS